MFGIVIITHGNLAKGFRSAATMIVGEKEISCIGLYPGHDLEYFERQVRTSIEEMKQKYQGVIVFTDLMYGTPFNKVSGLMEEIEFEHYTGTNLPILLEVMVKTETHSIKEVVEELDQYLSNIFIHVNKFLQED